MGVFKPRLSVRKIIAIGPTYLTSRELQYAVPRCSVPFHGSSEARINVCDALGDPAELQGATGADLFFDVQFHEEIVYFRGAVGTADQCGQAGIGL